MENPGLKRPNKKIPGPIVGVWKSIFLSAALLASTADAQWKTALPGWRYSFPADHGNHPDFKTEWWYFTGSLATRDGREFGYQLTFFRQGIIPPTKELAAASRFVTRNIQFAHFAVSDVTGKQFYFAQKLSRGAFGEAGFGDGTKLAWIEDWSCELTGLHSFQLRAEADGFAIDLSLEAAKPPVFHGNDGVSQKAEGEGRASHYYSLTRLNTNGTLTLGDATFPVEGLSWFDHEWATNQLAAHQTGWDWFSLQFPDGSELMIFQIRTADGDRDVHSGGTFVAADGKTFAIKNADFTLEPSGEWRSPATKGVYPTRWKLAIDSLGLRLDIAAAFAGQELALQPVSYWEGAIRANGTRDGKAVTAKGYLEMTGYGSPIVGMQATSPE